MDEQDPTPDQIQIEQAGPLRWSAHTVPALDIAMAAAQGEIGNAKENRKNPHLNSSYADLGSVINAVRGAFSKHGVARYQVPWTGDGGLYLTTRLAHKGEWVEADFRINVEEVKGLKKIQMAGSVISYVKRYTLAAMAGVASGDDDDGQSSSAGSGPSSAAKPSADTAEWRTAVKAFGEFKVKPPQLLAWLNRHSPEDLEDRDHEDLKGLYARIKNGSTMEEEMKSG